MRQASIGFAFLFLFCLSATAQDTAPEKPKSDRLSVERADKDRDVYKGLTVGKKFTGRLPTGYKEVVSNSQREEIYKLQQEYFETLELLKARMELLESERNLKMDGLLTGDQRVKLKTILSNLESEKNVRKGERVPAKKSAKKEEKPAEEKPAEN